jgi:hypothetical protein
MTQDNSACGGDLGRRRFLGGFLGLGTGAAVFGPMPPRPSLGREEADLSADSTPKPMSEYERLLSETTRMELLGNPRDWSVVRHQFHPFHPQRIAILPSGDRLRYRNRCGRQLRKKLDEAIELKQREFHGGPHFLPWEKVESTFWIMDLMSGHYRVPEMFEGWVMGLVGRESLASSSFGCHCGLVHQFQQREEIRVDNPPVDWWLFLFPDGIDWEHLGGEAVHALIGHISRFSYYTGNVETMLRVWGLTCSLGGEDWRTISRMGRIDAARHLNESTVRLLEEGKH